MILSKTLHHRKNFQTLNSLGFSVSSTLIQRKYHFVYFYLGICVPYNQHRQFFNFHEKCFSYVFPIYHVSFTIFETPHKVIVASSREFWNCLVVKEQFLSLKKSRYQVSAHVCNNFKHYSMRSKAKVLPTLMEHFCFFSSSLMEITLLMIDAHSSR